MTLLPTPKITLDGLVLNAVPAPGTESVLGSKVTVMAPLVIDWGRSDPWSQPSPAQMTLTLWDPFGEWAGRFRDGLALHRSVVASWSIGAQSYTFFRGHTVAGSVERAGHYAPDAAEPGWWVHLTVADASAMLGNQLMTGPALAAEAMGTRFARIRQQALAAGAGLADVVFDPAKIVALVGPLDVSDSTLLELLEAAYQSLARVALFDPSRNKIVPSVRPFIPGETTGYLVGPDGGRVLHIVGGSTADGIEAGLVHASFAVDGSVTTSSGATTFDLASDVNTVGYTYPNASDGYKEATTTVTGAADGEPRRSLSWKSWYSAGDMNSTVLYEAWARIEDEASRPAHPTITIDTRRTGGFMGVRQARALTLPAETPRVMWINGSQFARWAGKWAPAFMPIGGRIEFDGEHWRIDVVPAWFGGTPRTSSATWASFVDPIKWTDTDHNTLADGVTWWDASHLTTGGIYGED